MVQDVSKLPYPDGPPKTPEARCDHAISCYHDGLIDYDELVNQVTFYLINAKDYAEFASIVMMCWARIDPNRNPGRKEDKWWNKSESAQDVETNTNSQETNPAK
jgi:hypothetical protein